MKKMLLVIFGLVVILTIDRSALANPPGAKSGNGGSGGSSEVNIPNIPSDASPEERIRLEIARQVEELTKRIKEGTPQFSMNGPLEVNRDGGYMVNGENFIINSETETFGELKVGGMVEVRGYLKPGQPKVAFKLVFFETQSDSKAKPVSVQATSMR